ncbi:PilZ domain-containing protein [Thiosocius teredinicola]|uniref:PilZ domain-containing protein n=1 Tax=Thiosocius teredinicola TaxID=1973002 RepID=UPI0009911C90
MQERRLFPRYSYEQPMQLVGLDGELFDAESSDISVNGIVLQTTRHAVVGLAQGGAILTAGDRVKLRLYPETANNGNGILLEGRARHVRRLSQDRYLVGVWFDRQTDEGSSGLVDLVEMLSNSG